MNKVSVVSSLRMAVIINQSQNERYVFTNPLPLLKSLNYIEDTGYGLIKKEISYKVFSEHNISRLFREELGTFSSVLFFSNSLHQLEIFKTVESYKNDILNFLENGGGIFISHQTNPTELNCLPEPIKPEIAGSEYQIKAESDLIISVQEKHTLLNIPWTIVNITPDELEAGKHGYDLFYNIITDYPRSIYTEILQDVKSTKPILLAGNYHGGKIVFTTMILDWHRLRNVLENIIVWISGNRYIALYIDDIGLRSTFKDVIFSMPRSILVTYPKDHISQLIPNLHYFDHSIVDLRAFPKGQKTRVHDELIAASGTKTDFLFLDAENIKGSVSLKIGIDFQQKIDLIMLQRDKTALWDNSVRKTLEILHYLFDAGLISHKESIAKNSIDAILRQKHKFIQEDVHGLSLFYNFLSRIDQGKKITKEILRKVMSINFSHIDFSTRIKTLTTLMRSEKPGTFIANAKNIIREIQKIPQESYSSDRLLLSLACVLIATMEKNNLLDAEFLPLKSTLFKKLNHMISYIPLEYYFELPDIIEILELQSNSKLRDTLHNLYIKAYDVFMDLDKNFPKVDMLIYVKFLSFWSKRVDRLHNFYQIKHLLSALTKPTHIDHSAHILNEQLAKKCIKLEKTINFFFRWLNLTDMKQKYYDYIDNVDDISLEKASLKHKFAAIFNVFKACFKSAFSEYGAYIKEISVGVSIISILTLISFSLIKTIFFLPNLLFFLLLGISVACFIYLNIERIKKRFILRFFCLATTLILSFVLLYIFVLMNFNTLNSLCDLTGKQFFQMPASIFNFPYMLRLPILFYKPYVIIFLSMDIAGGIARRSIKK